MDRKSGRTVIIPMDHGTTVGPIKGLLDIKKAINDVVEGGANAILMHKGIVNAGHRGGGKDVGLIVHLSASTIMSPDPDSKSIVCSIKEAIRLGADAVSVHVNLGAAGESNMLRDLGKTADECQGWGMPLLAMMYTRGKKISNEYDVKHVKHAARVGAELGADIVKVNYTGSPKTFREVVKGCPVPVVIAGGEKVETEKELLEMIQGCVSAGGAGVSIGRNVFQSNDPAGIVKTIGKIVHGGCSLDKVLKDLK